LIQQKQKLAKNKEAADVRTLKGIMAKVPAQRGVSISVENELKSIVNNK